MKKAHKAKAKISTFWKDKSNFSRPRLAMYIAAFAVVGSLLLILSHAATPINYLEPEQGSIAGCAGDVTDSSASGGHSVQFKACPVGGGPAIPSDITTATPASKMIGIEGYENVFTSVDRYPVWKSWGFAGHAFSMGNRGQNEKAYMRGTSALGGGSMYDWQNGYEGNGVPGINGSPYGTTGLPLGPVQAYKKDPSMENYNALYLWPPTTDWWDDTAWNTFADRWGGLAAGTKFLGAKGFYWDTEAKEYIFNNSPPAGKTEDQLRAQIELRGYQVGLKIYQNYPDINIMYYDAVPGGTFFDSVVYNNGATTNLTHGDMLFYYGVLRAGAELKATGHFAFLDNRLGYRGGTANTGASLQTAIKWSTQGMLAEFSKTLPAATRDWWMPRLDFRLFTWGSTAADSYDFRTETSVAQFNAEQEVSREWSMGGSRAEYVYLGTPDSIENVTLNNDGTTLSKWYGLNVYSGPPGRLAGMQTAASTDGSYSKDAPTLTNVSASRSGTNVTITARAAHPFGIAHLSWRAYAADNTTVTNKGEAVMSFNLNGGSVKGGIPNSYQDSTIVIPNAISGRWVVVDAWSTLGQRHSIRLQLP